MPFPGRIRRLAAPGRADTADMDAFLDVVEQAFGAPRDRAEREVDRAVLDPARSLVCAVPDGGGEQLVGTTTSFRFALSVPGAVLPAAGITAVAVAPTARRRGVLSALLAAQLGEIAAAGEPLAVLFAAEAAIYGRFGFGAAAAALALTVPRPSHLRVPAGPGTLRLAEPEAVRAELVGVYDAVAASRPGWYARGEAGWRMRLFDPPDRRRGRTGLRAVLHSAPGGAVDGYALYRTKPAFAEARPDGEVSVAELVAADPGATAALWHYLLGLDLMARITAVVGLDDPVLALLVDPYLARPRYTDNLWVRLLDLPAALAGRRYAHPVEVTLEVADPLLGTNSGRWRLRAGPESAACRPTGEPADLVLDVDALGAAYLGGMSLAALAGAGRVRAASPAVLATASTAFGWPRLPFCPQLF